MSSTNVLFTEERRRRILVLLREKKKLTVNTLCHQLDVSPATIRTDLRELDQEGLLTRTHGGAIEKSRTGFELTASVKRTDNLVAKQAIAWQASQFIEDGDTIVLDTGTTTLELARCLVARERLTVVTNDLEIALLLENASGIHTLLLGGTLRRDFHCTMGPLGQHMARELRVDKAFMGANSLSLQNGVGTPDLQQAEMKKTMISIARQVIVLCDHTKIGHESFARFANLEQVDIVITDQINDSAKQSLEECNIQVVVAASAT